jgi:adenosylcobinamide-GDP ribazoletransferase
MSRRRVEEARLALMLLTRLPAGRLADPAPSLAAARWAYPLVGLVTGGLAAAAHAGALALGFGPLVAALLALTTAALVTGALHLDGLADFADGIGGGRDRAHCLEIMRDSRIGSYGVIALVLATGARRGRACGTARGAAPATLLLAATGSRLAMLVVLDRLPPARPDGLGRGASGSAPLAWVPGAAVVAALSVWTGSGRSRRWPRWPWRPPSSRASPFAGSAGRPAMSLVPRRSRRKSPASSRSPPRWAEAV